MWLEVCQEATHFRALSRSLPSLHGNDSCTAAATWPKASAAYAADYCDSGVALRIRRRTVSIVAPSSCCSPGAGRGADPEPAHELTAVASPTHPAKLVATEEEQNGTAITTRSPQSGKMLSARVAGDLTCGKLRAADTPECDGGCAVPALSARIDGRPRASGAVDADLLVPRSARTALPRSPMAGIRSTTTRTRGRAR